MPGQRLRVASTQKVDDVTKYVGCAVAFVVAGCGEANVISEHSSNTTKLCTTYLQHKYVFCDTHDLQR